MVAVFLVFKSTNVTFAISNRLFLVLFIVISLVNFDTSFENPVDCYVGNLKPVRLEEKDIFMKH